MDVAHEWSPIENLPSGWGELCRDDLHATHEQWIVERDLLKDPEKVQQFQERLSTLWAIETGIIERLYTFDRGVTIALVEAGLEALGKLHAEGRISDDARALIQDQHDALEMVMDLVGRSRDLSTSYVKELHHRLTLSQEYCDAQDTQGNPMRTKLIKGEWKILPNNPTRADGRVHEYCPPEFVQDEIDQLLTWYGEREAQEVCSEVEAAWLHHRFTQIHPFQDGNGRVARALTAGIFIKAGDVALVIRDTEHRERYLDALAAADNGDLRPLVDLFSDIQIADLNEAIEFVRSLRGEPLIELVESVAQRARRRQQQEETRAREVTDRLVEIAFVRLEEVAGELDRQFERQGVSVQARAFADDPDSQGYWTTQIVEAAKHHGYWADLHRFRRWVRLRLRMSELERSQTDILVSFHAVGRAADLRAVSAFLSTSEQADTGASGGDPPDAGRRWEFQIAADHHFTYRTGSADVDATMGRFRDWLEDAVQLALSRWADRF